MNPMTYPTDSNDLPPTKMPSIWLRVLLLLAGVAAAVGAVWWFTTGQLIHDAKIATASQFRDPDSVQFRHVRVVNDVVGKQVCGELNAKNGFGAYVGFVKFVYSPPFKGGSGIAVIAPEEGDTSRPLWPMIVKPCGQTTD